MTLFEILNFNRELLERLAGTGYKPDDYKYIDLYREYEQMRRKGDKVTYCVAFLSARHGVSERKVYEILGRFKKECTCHTEWKERNLRIPGEKRRTLHPKHKHSITRQNDYSNEKVLL